MANLYFIQGESWVDDDPDDEEEIDLGEEEGNEEEPGSDFEEELE